MIRRILLLLSLLSCALLAAAAPLRNQLANHPSPYLALHGHDPVAWQDWDARLLERARREGRLIFISSGYFSCHWCHVMQRESYSDSELAALINRDFIPVKVDRELHPALDAYLIDFVERTRGAAGWPLNVFLTPDGHPVFGLTYAPPHRFKAMLQGIARTWREDPERLTRLASEAAAAMQQQEPPRPQSVDVPALMHNLQKQAADLINPLQGGVGGQNHFPLAPVWLALLALPERPAELDEMIRLTLDQMARLGLRDHLRGGFFRYTVDPDWHTPHYEKMLYSQALLVRLYLRAARVYDAPAYAEVARDTLDFVLREMRADDGGFIASLSAVDAEGEEGVAYLWDAGQLAAVLDAGQQRLAGRLWGLPQAGEPGAHLPMLADGLSAEALNSPAARALRQRLRDARSNLPIPRDDKRLTAWNALLLSALVDAAGYFESDRYRSEAQRLRDYLVDRLWGDGDLARARDGRRAIGRAGLNDYAYLAQALWQWAVLADSATDRRLSLELQRQAWSRFYRNGRWQRGDGSELPGMQGQPAIVDAPLPSAPALLLELALQTDDGPLHRQAQQAQRLAFEPVRDDPFWYASYLPAMTWRSD